MDLEWSSLHNAGRFCDSTKRFVEGDHVFIGTVPFMFSPMNRAIPPRSNNKGSDASEIRVEWHENARRCSRISSGGIQDRLFTLSEGDQAPTKEQRTVGN